VAACANNQSLPSNCISIDSAVVADTGTTERAASTAMDRIYAMYALCDAG